MTFVRPRRISLQHLRTWNRSVTGFRVRLIHLVCAVLAFPEGWDGGGSGSECLLVGCRFWGPRPASAQEPRVVLGEGVHQRQRQLDIPAHLSRVWSEAAAGSSWIWCAKDINEWQPFNGSENLGNYVRRGGSNRGRVPWERRSNANTGRADRVNHSDGWQSSTNNARQKNINLTETRTQLENLTLGLKFEIVQCRAKLQTGSTIDPSNSRECNRWIEWACTKNWRGTFSPCESKISFNGRSPEFMRVSPNASTESATELVSLARSKTSYLV